MSLRPPSPLSLAFIIVASIIASPVLAQIPSETVRAPEHADPDWSKFPAITEGSPAVRIVKVSSGRTIHRFFDTSPFSPSGRYLALFRFPREDRSPRAGDVGEVILVDLRTGTEKVVARSRGYEMQLGANVQWGVTDEELYFNDVDPETWRAFAVRLNPLTGVARPMDGTVFMVSPDGQRLASYDLVTSRRAQVGYGVIVPDDTMPPRQYGPTDAAGVDLTDTATGKCRRLVTIREIHERSRPGLEIPNPDDHEFYCFQVKWNPQGTRLLTTLQWTPRADPAAGRRRAVITMRPDGTELRTAVTPAQWSRGGHHVNWMPDGEHLSMNLNVGDEPGLKIITVKADGSDLRVIYRPGSGHPSQHPGGRPWFVTDAYPDEPVAAGDGTSPLRLLNTANGTEQRLMDIFVSMVAGEFRIDPHPAWDRTGRFVAFNGYLGGTRAVYVADVSPFTNAS